ncbi:MAG: flagellar basal body P-ring protein FlgI [Phycisphaerae bacterium]|nr:flagellar basal body P-ring protein FlgI [Phycisphaerae bacterium]
MRKATGMMTTWRSVCGLLLVASLLTSASAEVLVQDIAHLQGEHVNRLMGYGLVVGLPGTGDGGKSAPTLRALAALHQRYEQNVLALEELENDKNVARVLVEVETPRNGWRSGERLDVVVTALSAKSLVGGQLLATPLQVSPLPVNPPPGMDRIWSIAGGRVDLPNEGVPTRGIIRGGAIMEEDWYHSFIQDQHITLVLDDARASFPLAQMVARAIEQELSDPTAQGVYERDEQGNLIVETDVAVALGPNTVRVRVPSYELTQPAGFISRVLQTPLFIMPKQRARVVINRTTNHITMTGTVTILPTVVQIPGFGTVSTGGGQTAGNSGVVGVATEAGDSAEFQQLLQTLEQFKISPEQTVQVIEQLHETGTLQAQLVYTE